MKNQDLLNLIELQHKMIKKNAKQTSILYVINGILLGIVIVHIILG